MSLSSSNFEIQSEDNSIDVCAEYKFSNAFTMLLMVIIRIKWVVVSIGDILLTFVRAKRMYN